MPSDISSRYTFISIVSKANTLNNGSVAVFTRKIFNKGASLALYSLQSSNHRKFILDN